MYKCNFNSEASYTLCILINFASIWHNKEKINRTNNETRTQPRKELNATLSDEEQAKQIINYKVHGVPQITTPPVQVI